MNPNAILNEIERKRDTLNEMTVAVVDSHPTFIQGVTLLLGIMFPKIKIFKFLSLHELEGSSFDTPLAFVLFGVNETIKKQELSHFKSIIKKFDGVKTIVIYTQITLTTTLSRLPVRGFISKSASMAELTKCIDQVLKNEIYFDDQALLSKK